MLEILLQGHILNTAGDALMILSFTTLALSCLQAKTPQVVTAHLILIKLPLKLTWTSLIRIPRTKNETLEEKSPVAVSI
jgi:hypothetical protein